MSYMTLLENIKENEGFRAKPYNDTLGKLTIGFGTLLEYGITKDEAFALLKLRLDKVKKQFEQVETYQKLNENRQMIILEMGYQMGFNGVMNFKKMWKALENKDYEEASWEMQDSKWYTQTRARANNLIYAMKMG